MMPPTSTMLSLNHCLEIEDLFIDGEEVLFNADIEGISPSDDFPTLRVVPLLITADSRAHSEIGLTTAGEYCGCRRCTVMVTYIQEKRHYYYGEFRCRFPFRSALRTVEDNRRDARLIKLPWLLNGDDKMIRELLVNAYFIAFMIFVALIL